MIPSQQASRYMRYHRMVRIGSLFGLLKMTASRGVRLIDDDDHDQTGLHMLTGSGAREKFHILR